MGIEPKRAVHPELNNKRRDWGSLRRYSWHHLLQVSTLISVSFNTNVC